MCCHACCPLQEQRLRTASWLRGTPPACSRPVTCPVCLARRRLQAAMAACRAPSRQAKCGATARQHALFKLEAGHFCMLAQSIAELITTGRSSSSTCPPVPLPRQVLLDSLAANDPAFPIICAAGPVDAGGSSKASHLFCKLCMCGFPFHSYDAPHSFGHHHTDLHPSMGHHVWKIRSFCLQLVSCSTTAAAAVLRP